MSVRRRLSRGLSALLCASLAVAAAPFADDVLPCNPVAAFDVAFTRVDATTGLVEVEFDVRPLRAMRDVTWELELSGTVSLVEGAPRDAVDEAAGASGRLLLRVPADGLHKTAELVVRGTLDGVGRDGEPDEETVVVSRMLEWERPEAFLPRVATRDAGTGLAVLAERVPSSWTAAPGRRAAPAHRAGRTPDAPLPQGVASSGAAPGVFTVTGTFLYEDKAWGWKGWTGARPMLPIRRANVVVLDDATGAVLGQGTTAQDGTFAVVCTSAGPVDLVAQCEADTNLDTSFQRVYVTTPYSVEYVLQGPVFPGHDGVSDLDVGTASALITQVAGKDGNPFNVFDVAVRAWEWLWSPEIEAGFTPPPSYGPEAVRNVWPNGPTTVAGSQGAYMGYDDCYDDPVILHELGHVVQTQYAKISAGMPHAFGDSDLDPRTSFMEGFATAFAGAVLADMGRRAIYVDSAGQASTGSVKLRANIETLVPYTADARGCSDELAVCGVLFDILDDASTPDVTPGVDDDPFDGSLLVAGQTPTQAFWGLFTGDMTETYRMTHNDTWDSWATVYPDDPSTELLRAHCASFGQVFSEDAAEPDDIPARATLLPASAAWTGPRTFYAPDPGTLAPGPSDQDWFAHGLVKGSVVTFETRYPGAAADADTQADPQLELFTPGGERVAWDGDSGTGRNARIAQFTVTETGLWTVRVRPASLDWPFPQDEVFRRYGQYEYRALEVVPNHLPHVVAGPEALPSVVRAGDRTRLHADAEDPDAGQALEYLWRPLDGGKIVGSGPDVTFVAPHVAEPTTVRVQLVVRDELGAESPPRVVTVRVAGGAGVSARGAGRG